MNDDNTTPAETLATEAVHEPASAESSAPAVEHREAPPCEEAGGEAPPVENEVIAAESPEYEAEVEEEAGETVAEAPEPESEPTEPEPEPTEPEPEPTEPEPVAEAPAPAVKAPPEKKAKKEAAVAVPAETVAAEAETAVVAEAAPAVEEPPESLKKWYVIKVTSNREESIKAAIERRVKIEGLEEFFGQIVIPVERITQVKKVIEKKKDTGEKVTKEKRVVKENKKFPGYLFAEVEYNDRILYLFRETSGVGDFVGASLHRAPTPMTDKEVQAMLHGIVDPKDKSKSSKTVVKLDFEKGDKVRIREGAFANSEGEVKQITEPKDAGDTPKVTVVVTIWGRPVDVELDYWQVDKV